MFTGFLSYAGTEIVNAARLASYSTALNITGATACDTCPTLRTSLEQAVYTTPAADNAPWYDPSVPESGQIAGFQIVSIEGTGDTASRPVDELSRDGGIVGRRRRSARNLAVTFRAVASTECALNYAVGWLSRVLRGNDCSPVSNIFLPSVSTGCAGETLCILTCCPTVPADIDKYQRTLYKTGVTEGPTILTRQSAIAQGAACGIAMCEVEVVFTSGDPGWYGNPVTIFNGAINSFLRGLAFYDIEVTYDFYGCGSQTCSTSPPPGCTTTDSGIFTLLPTPCIGTHTTTSNLYSIPLSFAGISTWIDQIPIITYTGGDGAFYTPNEEGPVGIQLRRATTAEPCGVAANPCNVPLEVFAPRLNRASETVFDWVNRKAFAVNSVIDLCPVPIYTRQLAPFNWPTIVCGADMCMDVYIDSSNDSRGSRIKFELMGRQDAIC